MTAKEFLSLNVAGMVRQLDEWDDGNDAEGFKAFVLDFFDNVILRFKPESGAERWSDFFIHTAGNLGFDEIAATVRDYIAIVTEARPFAGLAERL